MENKPQYNDFAINDFLSDAYFQDWIIHPSLEKNQFWQEWLLQHPDKENIVNTARNILSNLDFKVNVPTPRQAQQSLEKALAVIDTLEANQTIRRSLLVRFNRVWKVAAILIVTIGLSLLAYTIYNTSATLEIATAYGKLDTLLLPDQSIVILNANSNIRYKKQWNEGKPREVWLEGEAFFAVQHLDKDRKIEPQERFIVHLQDADVEVLGTSFNVRERRGKTEVVLQQGSVKVSFTDKKQAAIIMKPGEIITINPAARQKVALTTTNPANYTAWKTKRLLLDNPTLQEITAYLEDTYGKKIVLRDPKLAVKQVNGPILIDSLEDALFIISTVLDVRITEENDTLFISSK